MQGKTAKKPQTKEELDVSYRIAGFHGLTQEHEDVVRNMLLQGQTDSRIALYLTKAGATEISRTPLMRRIAKFRKWHLGPQIVQAYDLLDVETSQGLREKMHVKLDGMQELENLIMFQKARIDAAKKHEKIGTKDYMRRDISSAMRLMSEMLTAYLRVQMDLGLLKRAPAEFSGKLTIGAETRERMEVGLNRTTLLAQATASLLERIGSQHVSQHVPQTVEQESP